MTSGHSSCGTASAGRAKVLILPEPEDVVLYGAVGTLLAYWIFMIFIRPFV